MKKRFISILMAVLVVLGVSSQVADACCYKKTQPKVTTGTLLLIKRDAETNKALPGAYFRILNEKGQLVANISSNGATYDPENGNVYTGGLQYMYGIGAGTYYLQEIQAPNGYELLTEKIKFTITANQTTTLTVKNKAKATTGSLKITKTDADTGAVLSGAEFSVKDSAGVSQTGTTNSTGTATFTNLKAGNVTINETKAPAGYVAANSESTATITTNEETAVTITNTKEQLYGSLKITKTDASNGKVLSGADFKVIDSKGNTQSGSTDASGTVTFSNLSTGSVSVQETKAPTGYVAANSIPNATVNANQEAAITVENTQEQQSGSLKIYKVDASSDDRLSGAEFKVTDSAGNVQTGTTDADGVLLLSNLSVGNATIEETKAPVGFVKSSTVVTARITNNFERSVIITNSKNAAVEVKAEDTNGKAIEGAEFLVYSKGINVGKTDANGLFVAPASVGSVNVCFVSVPDGYTLTTEPNVSFKLTGNELVKRVTYVFSYDNGGFDG